jgi:hypothetical protein
MVHYAPSRGPGPAGTLTIDPLSTTIFSAIAVAHVFSARPALEGR